MVFFVSKFRSIIYDLLLRKSLYNNFSNSSWFFDEAYYREASPDVQGGTVELVWHYVRYGFSERRSPSQYFDVKAFSDAHPSLGALNIDLAEACLRLYDSYAWSTDGTFAAFEFDCAAPVSFTLSELRKLRERWTRYRSFFDAEFYLSEYPEIATTPNEAFKHYMHRGFLEDRQPRSDFDGYYYRKAYGLSRGQNPFRHCIDKIEPGMSFPSNTMSRPGLQLFLSRPSVPHSTIGFPTQTALQLSLCIHVHCFYTELFSDVVERLRHLTFPFSLVVTVCNQADAELVHDLLIGVSEPKNTYVLVVENRGRDIAPFLIDASHVWRKSDLVLHLHTKKSPHVPWGDNWRRYLFDQTIGQEALLKCVLEQFRDRSNMGVMYPENYCLIRRSTEEENNRDAILYIAKKLHLDCDLEALRLYPAGSMAFYRVTALVSILDNPTLKDIFEPEQGQFDGTAAHVLERLLPEVVRQNGFEAQSYFVANSKRTQLA